MKQVYISCSFSKSKEFEPILKAIKKQLQTKGFKPMVFVQQYEFLPTQEKQMMTQALKDIDNSVLLIGETSEKGIGIGIEAGYAKAKGIPVVYMRCFTADHSTTLSGMANYHVIYQSELDLAQQLTQVLKQVDDLLE